MDWIDLAQYRDMWWGVVNMAMNIHTIMLPTNVAHKYIKVY
jgi:hypothetical protein